MHNLVLIPRTALLVQMTRPVAGALLHNNVFKELLTVHLLDYALVQLGNLDLESVLVAI